MFNKIIKLDKVKEYTTFSAATNYRKMKKGEFPKQVKLSSRSSGWVEDEVLGYVENCINNR